MAIDIDSFLEDFDDNSLKADKEKKEKADKSKKKIDLEFEGYLGKKFSDLKERVNDEDFAFLLKAYEEIKKFDETLPKKLLGIQQNSSAMLNEFGTRYSNEFFKGVKQNMINFSSQIRNGITQIDEALKQNQIQKAITIYNELNKIYKMFPKEFIDERISIGNELRKRDVIINNDFSRFWKLEVAKIKKEISKTITELKHELIPGNIKPIETKVNELNLILEKIPKVFFAEFLNERSQISKIITITEEFLQEQYKNEFLKKEAGINTLLDRFHRYQIKKDVDSALATYDELIISFNNMPNIYLDKKIEIYAHINKTFETLNNLLISNNVSTFMETYQYSKTLIEAKEYINFAKTSRKASLSNLLSIRDNLAKIPVKLKPEKSEVEIEIENLISLAQRSNNERKHINQETMKVPSKKEVIETLSEPKKEIIETPKEPKKEIIETPKEYIKSKPKPKSTNNVKTKVELISKDIFKKDQKSDVNLTMVDEINKNYNLILGNNDVNEKIRLNKKIKFYLNLLPLNKIQAKEISEKIDQETNKR